MKQYSLLASFALAACSSSSGPGNTVYFDLAHANTQATYWNYPFPSAQRLDTNGSPDVANYPNPRHLPILQNLLDIIPLRHGWPLMPAGYFRFTDAITMQFALDQPMTAGPVWLVDVDETSPELGTTYPTVATVLPEDGYVPSNLLAVAPRPGIVLRGNTQYAYVITKLDPAQTRAPGFTEKDPAFASTWAAIDMVGISRADVIVATEFTTGDEIARVQARAEAIHTTYTPAIENLTLAPTQYPTFCTVFGTITMPQFQTGEQPFDTGGLFVLDGNDVPEMQGSMTIPVTITLPNAAMPASGWPLYQFFHGSGGLSTGIVDLGPSPTPADIATPGEGPGYVVALHGIAAASSALPLNPERYPPANDYEYLNISNLGAFPQTFQQGVFEQRILTDALLQLHIPAATVAGCAGLSTTTGDHFFDATKLVAGGQSMGGMYTNMVGAVEPRFKALVPTGAGGFWNFMILESTIVPGARNLLGTALGVDDASLVFLHPAMNTIALAWEPAEPLVYMSRINHRPLPGMHPHDVYEPVGMGDSYFPSDVYDAAALSYEHQEAGTAIWPAMQSALALEHLDGLQPYPVKANEDGDTRVVVQYLGDGIVDPHYIYRQLDAVKHQYGCFLESYLRDGVPTVPPAGGLTDPCP
jgi:hypothetical protein